MEILFLLLGLSLVLVALIAAALLWAVRSGQFEDLQGPAYRILDDDDAPGSEDRPDRDREGRDRPAPPADDP